MSSGPVPREAPVPREKMLKEPGGAVESEASGPVGLQTLLDLLVGVYQEFQLSSPARDKYIGRFLQWGQCHSFTPHSPSVYHSKAGNHCFHYYETNFTGFT
ncbi:hypothetical protein MHYP_G00191960 [Metynnis hypsauchen]